MRRTLASEVSWLLLFFILRATNSSAGGISYSDHCSNIVPESRPTGRVRNLDIPLYDLTANSYFRGGENIIGRLKKSFLSDPQNPKLSEFEPHVLFRPVGDVLRTDTPGVYGIEARLVFRLRSRYRREYQDDSLRNQVLLRFLLKGFWSEKSRKLCMVGATMSASESSQKLESVFELSFGEGNSNPTIFTSLAKGSLKSLSPYASSSYFDPVEIVSVPYLKDYNYTMSCLQRSDLDVPPKQSLSLQKADFCSAIQHQTYEFEWENALGCNASQSTDCGPFEGSLAPSLLSLSAFQCSEEEENPRLRYILYFKDRESKYRRAFNPNSTYIGEGTWDREKNHLCISACRILNSFHDLKDVSVGDCSFRVRLRFPVVWTVRDTSSIVGVAWSSRTTMRLRSSNSMNNVPGLRYEYTETDKVRELCPNQVRKSGEHLRYPKGDSYDTRLQMSDLHSKERIDFGSAVPIAVGEKLYGQSWSVMDSGYGGEEVSSNHGSHGSQINVSYNFHLYGGNRLQDKFFSVDSSVNYGVRVSAEGVYDSATGNLCMVGCRGIHLSNSSAKIMDCEIFMRFEFPSLHSKVGSSINGFIESRRGKDDALYFKPLNVSSRTCYICSALTPITVKNSYRRRARIGYSMGTSRKRFHPDS